MDKCHITQHTHSLRQCIGNGAEFLCMRFMSYVSFSYELKLNVSSSSLFLCWKMSVATAAIECNEVTGFCFFLFVHVTLKYLFLHWSQKGIILVVVWYKLSVAFMSRMKYLLIWLILWNSNAWDFCVLHLFLFFPFKFRSFSRYQIWNELTLKTILLHRVQIKTFRRRCFIGCVMKHANLLTAQC